jgi:hypothetical protein
MLPAIILKLLSYMEDCLNPMRMMCYVGGSQQSKMRYSAGLIQQNFSLTDSEIDLMNGKMKGNSWFFPSIVRLRTQREGAAKER